MVVWKVRADCTYTTSNNKNARQAEAQAVLDTSSGWTPVAGRFAPGITSESSTRFTISVDVDDEATARALMDGLRSALTGSSRSTTYFSIHDAGDG